METILKDLKHSLRMFRQNPGFTATALAALVIGIGLNTAIFSIINTVLLKPPGFADPDRILMFMNTSPEGQGGGGSPAKLNHWRAQTSVVHDVAAFRTGVVNWTNGDVPEQLRSGQVSAAFFRLFGAPILQGRSFSREEDLPNGPHVALIGEGLWRNRFHADPNILGKTILLGGEPHPVIGVVGSGFDFREFGPQPDVWVPFQLDSEQRRSGPLFPGSRTAEPGSHDPARACAHCCFGCRIRSQVSAGAGTEGRVQHRAIAGCAHAECAGIAGRARRGCVAGAVDRVRECGKSVAGARHRSKTRDCDSRFARRGPWQTCTAVADRKSDPLRGRGGVWVGIGHRCHARTAFGEYGESAAGRR